MRAPTLVSARIAADAKTLVRCRNLARTFGHGRSATVAVHDATCDIRVGDRVALVGPSGSGKSTLLHLFAGLEQPTTGTITWPALGERGPAPGSVAVVFQGTSLIPFLDVLENVALPVLLRGGDPRAALASARDALASVGLERLASALPDELSGGQAQRVAVARAIASGARLLLADEPTGQLDHESGIAVVDALLTAAAHADAALVIATHDPTVARRLATRWDVVDGRLVTDDGPA